MENFTPVSGFAGGLLIGAAASLLIVLNGRIAGISGILGGIFGAKVGDLAWRIAFIAGIVAGPFIVGLAGGTVPGVIVDASLPMLVAAGLLVGIGTRLGGGCTSGHGVCGIARLSPRSLIATAVFFAVAVVTVYLSRHLVGG